MSKKSVWMLNMLQAGKKTNFILWSLFVVFSGIGSFFLIQSNDKKYFDKKVNFNRQIVQVFFNGNYYDYLIHIGKCEEAMKHGIMIKIDDVISHLRSMPIFLDNNKQFDEKKYLTWLKDNKLTHNDLLEYAKREVINKIFTNIFKNYPLQIDLINNLHKNNYAITSVKGQLLYLKPEYLIKYEPTEEDFDNFMRTKIEEYDQSIIEYEKRSGFLVKVKTPNTVNVMEINKIISQNLKLKNITRTNAIEAFKHILPNVDFEIIDISLVEKTDGLNSILFDNPLEFIKFHNDLYFPIVETIRPKEIKQLTAEVLSNCRIFCKTYYEQLYNKIKLTELANNFNHQKISKAELLKMCKVRMVDLPIEDRSVQSILLMGCAKDSMVVIKDHNDVPVMFLCDTKTRTNTPTSTKIEQDWLVNNIIEAFLIYWIENNQH